MIDMIEDDVEQRFMSRNIVQLAQTAAIQYPYDPLMMFTALRTAASVYGDTHYGVWRFEADNGKSWKTVISDELIMIPFKDKRFIRFPFRNHPVYSMHDEGPSSNITVAFQANKGISTMCVLVAMMPKEISVMYLSAQAIESDPIVKEIGEFLTGQLV